MVSKLRVAIYAPISLWEMHQAQVADIVWQEYETGAEITLLSCKKGLAFCAANPSNKTPSCYECIYRTKYLFKEILPPSIKKVWLQKKEIDTETEVNLKDVKTHDQLENFTFEGWQVGKTVMSELVSLTRSIYISNEEIEVLAHRNLRYSIGMYLQAKEILNDKFDRIYIWGGRRSSEDCVAAAARFCSIPIVYFEVGSSVDKYLVTSNEPHSFYGVKKEILDFAEESDDAARGELSESAKKYFESLRFGNAHTPHFRNFLAGYDKEMPREIVASSKPVLTVFTSSAWEFAFFRDYDRAPEEFLDIYALYLRIALDEEIHSRYTVVFRWHPNLINAGKLEVEKVTRIIETSKNLCIHIKPEDRFNSYEILELSGVIVTTGSTIGIEGAYLRIPTVLLGNALYGGLGSVYEPTSYSAFKELLLNQPKALPIKGAQLWANWTSNYGRSFRFVTRRNKHYFFRGQRIGATNFTFTQLYKIYKVGRKVFS